MIFIKLAILLLAFVWIACEGENPRPLSLMQQREKALSDKKIKK